MAADRAVTIRPQDGPQTQFLASEADIAIYGGAAGGGKTWALLLGPIRHMENKDFGCVFFRRTTVQIRNEGGLWDESAKLYRLAGATPKEASLEWRFPSGASISFAHLEHDKNANDYQGAQIPLICFDELTHFNERQFWYLLSRNRSMCGVKPYIRATCNPDVDSWVASFIAWWIDEESGYPIPERAGVLRWFVRISDRLVWADQPDDLAHYVDADGKPIPPKSVTFIPAKLSDNKRLTEADPGYVATLMALPEVDRERLLGGNWKIRETAGLLFQRAWVNVIDVAPPDLEIIRGWDFAATPKTATSDPDSTSSTKIGRTRDGRFVVLDNTNVMEGPAGVEKHLLNVARRDGIAIMQSLPQDPGSSGKALVAAQTKALTGFNVRSSTESGDKVTRFNPFSAQAQGGNVDVLRGAWNEAWFKALEGFPPPMAGRGHDDDADSTARAFNAFLAPVKGAAFLELARRENAANDALRANVRTTKPEWQPGSMEYAAEQAELAVLAKDEADAREVVASA
jgi:predicted phage terminase large subunit-like protein